MKAIHSMCKTKNQKHFCVIFNLVAVAADADGGGECGLILAVKSFTVIFGGIHFSSYIIFSTLVLRI